MPPHSMGVLLIATGRIEQGLEIIDNWLRRDPSQSFYVQLAARARIYLEIQPERALELAERAAALQPDGIGLQETLYRANLLLGRNEAALAALIESRPSHLTAAIRSAYAEESWSGAYSVILADLDRKQRSCEVAEGDFEIYLRLRYGDLAGALECLERAYRSRPLRSAQFYATSPVWDPLRNEPRFRALMDQMNLTRWSGLRSATSAEARSRSAGPG